MKLAFSIFVDVDERVLPSTRVTIRDQLAEDLRAHLRTALEDPPVRLRDVHVWGRATPERVRRMHVESIRPTDDGRHRVTVRIEDARTTSRTFRTQQAAEAWADRIDPVFLPGDPIV